jgi:hypothetical protein
VVLRVERRAGMNVTVYASGFAWLLGKVGDADLLSFVVLRSPIRR